MSFYNGMITDENAEDTIVTAEEDDMIAYRQIKVEEEIAVMNQEKEETDYPEEFIESERTINPVMPTLDYNPTDIDHEVKKEEIKSKIPPGTYDNSLRPLKQEVYSHVNVKPQFPGGEDQLNKWLKANLMYPAAAAENRQEGRVIVRFVVYADGSIGEIQIRKSVNPALDKEALRVINRMPNWIPGKLDDEPVPVWYSLSITFQLQ